MELIAMVMKRRRLEWFGHVKRRRETENIRAVAEMKMEGKRLRGFAKLKKSQKNLDGAHPTHPPPIQTFLFLETHH